MCLLEPVCIGAQAGDCYAQQGTPGARCGYHLQLHPPTPGLAAPNGMIFTKSMVSFAFSPTADVLIVAFPELMAILMSCGRPWGQGEGRLEREISRLQAAAAADLERVRREVSEASERELRAMRELRDAAQVGGSGQGMLMEEGGGMWHAGWMEAGHDVGQGEGLGT